MSILYSKDDKNNANKKTKIIGDTQEINVEIPTVALSENIIPGRYAYKIIKDELMDEGNARMNLATFCQTSMEPEATQLMAETLEKNAIDKSEYPQTTELENRCIAIIAHLWNHNSKDGNFIGTSTVGSSEACMLGGLVLKFKWQQQIDDLVKSKKIKDDPTRKPNLVISSAYQICWEKFCVYWGIELRGVPIDENHLSLDPNKVLDYVDENTIGIVGILGLTYTGQYDDIEGLDKVVESYNQKYNGTRPLLKIHVDAASGGFFAPFVTPNLKWDFRLKNVVSISASGHKYGLVYPGIGWVIWKDGNFIPKELIFEVSYLGGTIPTIAINFSRSASQIIGQYYQFLRFGKKGYTDIQKATQEVGLYISNFLQETGLFTMVNDGKNIPVLCWKMKNQKECNWTLYDLSDELLSHGWQVPAYPLPANLQDVDVQRIVVRQDLSMDLANELVKDIQRSIAKLNEMYKTNPSESYINKLHKAHGFTH